MKMPNGGFNPAVNVQLAADTESRAIVGVDVTFEGTDSVGLSAPMRKQVEKRTHKKVQQHLIDGDYMRKEDIENACDVELFTPPKWPGYRHNRFERAGTQKGAIVLQSCAGRSVWPVEEGEDLQTASCHQRNRQRRPSNHRGLSQITVRGTDKVRSVAFCGVPLPTTSSTSLTTCSHSGK